MILLALWFIMIFISLLSRRYLLALIIFATPLLGAGVATLIASFLS